jgi:long-chain acyl-CoA synthetase
MQDNNKGKRRPHMNEVTMRSGNPGEKVWLASYPPSVPAEMPPLSYKSLADLFERAWSRVTGSL